MTWNTLVTQAAYSFAQARGQRTGKNLGSALSTKPGPRVRWLCPGQWVSGEGLGADSEVVVPDAPLMISSVVCSTACDRA